MERANAVCDGMLTIDGSSRVRQGCGTCAMCRSTCRGSFTPVANYQLI
jgi:hypothetical protein